MRGFLSAGWLARLAVLAGTMLAAATLTASDQIKGVRDFNAQCETVELFSGIEQGQLEVKLIPKDSTECRVLIANKTDEPLNVRVPGAFAGVPVLAQFLPGNFQPGMMPPGNANNPNNAPQRLGIGNPFGNDPFLGNQNNPFLGNRNNPLFNRRGPANNVLPPAQPNFAPFNVAPEGVAQLRLTCVCLDYGKDTPRPRMPYALEPIRSVTDEPEVEALCRMLGHGQVSQRAAQAAAWHLAGDMSWDQLARLRQKFAIAGLSKPFFTSRELAEAKKAAEAAIELAENRKEPADEYADSLSMR
jgi:hypothetical protein